MLVALQHGGRGGRPGEKGTRMIRGEKIRGALVAALSGVLLWAPGAQASDTLNDSIVNGKFDVNLRYRFEYVDQDGFTKDARASTMRAAVGYGTDSWHGLSAYLGVQGVFSIGNELYNSTVNGRTMYPVVADPEVFDLWQAYVQWVSPWDVTARAGRQLINYDNQRWIGTVAFRQNEQTYDAARLISTNLPDTAFEYIYVDNVNRVFGPHAPPGPTDGNFPMSSHLIHAAYTGFKPVTAVAYAYLLDFTRAADFGLSTASTGLRLFGATPIDDDWKVLYAGEYARQTSYASNPMSYGLNYYFAEGGVGYGPVTLKTGFESLEGNGTVAVQMPLSTLHLFQGWADQFLVTPASGVNDLYVLGNATVQGVNLTAVYHDLDAETGSADLGREFDAAVSTTIVDKLKVEFIFADYMADTFKTDTKKYWLAFSWSY